MCLRWVSIRPTFDFRFEEFVVLFLPVLVDVLSLKEIFFQSDLYQRGKVRASDVPRILLQCPLGGVAVIST